MKKICIRYGVFILLAAMLLSLVPGFTLRLGSEAQNKNVTVSLLYNDFRSKVSEEQFGELLEAYKEAGVRTISVMEEDVNALVARGDATCIKYNVLRHKYDAESIEIANFIEANCPRVAYDSHVIIAAREEAKAQLRYVLPRKYSDEDFMAVGTFRNFDIYVLYDGQRDLWNYPVGYSESKIARLREEGFAVALIYKVKNYHKTEYLDDLARLVKDYDVSYLNIKADSEKYAPEEIIPANYEKVADLIREEDMTLVVTENTNQLSNQACLGYEKIFAAAEEGPGKILRAYETYDESQADDTNYKYRVTQYFNSTIDRNIRFITVTQITPQKVPYRECAENTLRAVIEYKEKIEKAGFSTDGGAIPFAYTADARKNAAAAAAIMVLALLFMAEMIAGKMLPKTRAVAILFGILAFLGTFVLPSSLLALYPTAFCVIMSTFAVTVFMWFVKKKKDSLPTPWLALSALAVMLSALLIGAAIMGTLLSGLSYYINNSIFRGIKLSLLLPVFYAAALYYFLFLKTEETDVFEDAKKLLFSEIKVYWVAIGAVVLGVGAYYIIRSGNVNSISSLEQALRAGLTEIFPARPRTKEFLIGYPALILFVYYKKNTDCHFISWMLAVGASILAASVTNSFCHVFTDFATIVTRTVNGLLVGALVSAVAVFANAILRRLLAFGKALYTKKMEMK